MKRSGTGSELVASRRVLDAAREGLAASQSARQVARHVAVFITCARKLQRATGRCQPLAPAMALLVLLTLAGCTRDQWQRFPSPDDAIAAIPWFAVMHRGIAIQPYSMPRPPVPGTVPVTGTEVADTVIPRYYDRINRLVNPVQRTSVSIDRGRELYVVYCVPCHGGTGRGDGPIIAKFIRPPDLTAAPARGYTDGYLYALVASGRGLMPPYGDKVRGADRWHIVNYLRGVIQAGTP